eukprot:SM000067S20351  [mRNA]  locus=s67:509282:514056:+ [translate_table: standard]
MSHYDNPFDEDGGGAGGNPFSEGQRQAARPVAYTPPPKSAGTASFFDTLQPASVKPDPVLNSAAVTDATTEIPLGNSNKDFQKREKALHAKELALAKKEEELRKRELELAAMGGGDLKNWPPCFPFLHHDISRDIPNHLQFVQRMAYYSWLGILWCLLWNIIAVSASWIGHAVKGSRGFENWALAILYAALGYPLSYFLWYRRLYVSMRKDSSLGFVFFFVYYLVHCAFVIFAAVAPPFVFKGRSLSGILPAIQILADGHTVVGIFFIVGFVSFTLESLLSLFVMQQVYFYFRGTGKAAEAKREAALAGIRVDPTDWSLQNLLGRQGAPAITASTRTPPMPRSRAMALVKKCIKEGFAMAGSRSALMK